MLLKYNLLCLITSFISLAIGEEDEIVLANFCYNATYQGEYKRYLPDYDDDACLPDFIYPSVKAPYYKVRGPGTVQCCSCHKNNKHCMSQDNTTAKKGFVLLKKFVKMIS